MHSTLKTILAATTALGLGAGAALASDPVVKLRIQNHQAPESAPGKQIAKFVDRVHTMSNGSIEIEMFYSAAVVKSVETFDAAASGILDCDMTNGSYQTGKNAAFQFVADTMGGYDTPIQFQTWINFGGGKEQINALYNPHGMTYVGSHVGGQESLNSTRPLRGPDDLKEFKFRSPPGMETEIFASLGAKPVVMDFTEIFTALETGIIDGADAATLAINRSLGIYDIAKHTTYPGFHSMSADHLACRTDVWEGMTDAQRMIIETAEKALAMDLIMFTLVENGRALAELPAEGVTIYDWSPEDRAIFRAAAQEAWTNWAAKSPETAAIVESHKAFARSIGLSK